jgi:hemerythrin-like domain-containing protein
MYAIDALKAEHELIRRVLTVLEAEADRIAAGAEPRLDVLANAVTFFEGFIDACHHEKEERYLFPALSSKSDAVQYGPVSVMLAEHEEGRGYIGTLERAMEGMQSRDIGAFPAAVAALQCFCLLLRAHIEKEEEVLFQFAGRLLSPAEANQLAADFESVEAKGGAGAHERFHSLVDLLESTPV